MEGQLKALFDDVLIVPLDDVLVESLEELYDKAMEELDYDQVVMAFVNNELEYIKEELDKLYEAEVSETLEMPNVCYLLFAQYFIYRSVCLDDRLSDADKFQRSLSFRNAMLLQRAPAAQLLTDRYLDDIYAYVPAYVKSLSAIVCYKGTLYPAILGQKTFKEEQESDPHFFDEVKQLAIKAAKYDFERAKWNVKADDGQDDYVEAYRVASYLARYSQWYYIFPQVEQVICELLGQCKGNKTLAKIRDIVTSDSTFEVNDGALYSSVLLDYLDGKNLYEDKLGGQKMSPAVFALYLFYEKILENV